MVPMPVVNIIAFIAVCAFIAVTVHALSLGRSLKLVAANLEASRAEAEQRFAEAKKQRDNILAEYDTLMLQCGIGVMVLNSHCVVERANVTAAQYFGSREAAMIGKSVLEATLSHDLHNLCQEARDGKTLKREVRVSGHLAEYDLAVTVAMIDNSETSASYLLIAQNMSDLRRLEAVRRDFVANVSHELRTPLTSIRAVAETLQGGAMQDKSVAERFLNMIITESERLSRIADDLLILSAAESKTPTKDCVNLTVLLHGVIHRVQEQTERHKVKLTTTLQGGIMTMANADQMEQVFVNLIDNAIKYTPEGGYVTVTASQQNDQLTVCVKDTGIGIPQQDLPRIFERFYRVDKARSRQTGGTGLGLSIVKHIVETHGGHVTVESEYNHGSSFTVKLPALVMQTQYAVV